MNVGIFSLYFAVSSLLLCHSAESATAFRFSNEAKRQHWTATLRPGGKRSLNNGPRIDSHDKALGPKWTTALKRYTHDRFSTPVNLTPDIQRESSDIGRYEMGIKILNAMATNSQGRIETDPEELRANDLDSWYESLSIQ